MTQEKDTMVDALEPASTANDEQQNAKHQKINSSKKLLEKLSESYPDIFSQPQKAPPKALAIGLHKELSPIVQEWGFSAVVLRSALAWYTKQLRYQKALLYATHRVNLDGSQAEEILEEHKTLAKENIARIEAWLVEHRPESVERRNQNKEKNKKPRTAAEKSQKPKQKPKPANHRVKQEAQLPLKKDIDKSKQSLDEKMKSLVEKFNQ